MRVLVCGSVAIDAIMNFQGQFQEHIIADKISSLNVCFVAPVMRREFGGCAANIAYALKRLGGHPLVVATVGMDAEHYLQRFDALGIDRQYVKVIDGSYTAQAFITTDALNNQITTFHPGAMMSAHQNDVRTIPDYQLAVVSPDGRDAMLQHVVHLSASGCPFLFDPGQATPLFSGEELLSLIKSATWTICNEYESQLLIERTGLSLLQLAQHCDALIVTRGGKGSSIFTKDTCLDIPVVSIPLETQRDVTGCGDAYRGGLLYGLSQGWDWMRTGRLASVMGALKAQALGAQGDVSTRVEIDAAYHAAFSDTL